MKLNILVSCREIAEARRILHGIAAASSGDIDGNAEELSATLRRKALPHADVLLLESRCCDPASRKMLLRLTNLPGSTRVLLLVDKHTAEMFLDFISRGVSGCLPRDADFSVLAKAVRTVHAGQAWFNRASMVQAIRQQACDSSCPYHKSHEYDRLTSREAEILQCVGAGLSNKEIANRLQISVGTVQTVLHRVYAKFKISGRYKVFTALSSSARERLRPTRPSPARVPGEQAVGHALAEQPANMSSRCDFMQQMPECPYK